jgi:hypothetical protein
MGSAEAVRPPSGIDNITPANTLRYHMQYMFDLLSGKSSIANEIDRAHLQFSDRETLASTDRSN